MGFFKDLQNSAANGYAFQNQMNAAGAGTATGPQWAPILGVDLDRYTWLYVQLTKAKFPNAEASTEWLASQGVAPGTWAEINQGWQQRMSQYLDVTTRYGLLASQYGIGQP